MRTVYMQLAWEKWEATVSIKERGGPQVDPTVTGVIKQTQ